MENEAINRSACTTHIHRSELNWHEYLFCTGNDASAKHSFSPVMSWYLAVFADMSLVSIMLVEGDTTRGLLGRYFHQQGKEGGLRKPLEIIGD
jgi:hypothetical protein